MLYEVITYKLSLTSTLHQCNRRNNTAGVDRWHYAHTDAAERLCAHGAMDRHIQQPSPYACHKQHLRAKYGIKPFLPRCCAVRAFFPVHSYNLKVHITLAMSHNFFSY